MQKSENFEFNLPEGTDNYNVEHSNENFEKIDSELPNKITKYSGNVLPTSGSGLENPENVEFGDIYYYVNGNSIQSVWVYASLETGDSYSASNWKQIMMATTPTVPS